MAEWTLTILAAFGCGATPAGTVAPPSAPASPVAARRESVDPPDPTASLHGSSMARSPDGRWLYLADTEGDAIFVVDLSDRSLARFDVGGGPEELVVRGDGRVFVTLRTGGAVAAFDGPTLQPVGVARLGVEPFGVALSPDGRFVYATAAQSRTLTALDASTLEPVWITGLELEEPRGIAVDPDGLAAYVVHLREPSVSVVDLATGERRPSLLLPGEHEGPPLLRRGTLGTIGNPGVPNRAIAAVVSPDGKRLLVPFDLKDPGVGARTVYYGGDKGASIVPVLASIPLEADGEVATLLPLGGLDPVDARLEGNRLFVGGAGTYLDAFDVSDPVRPELDGLYFAGYVDAAVPVGDSLVSFDPLERALYHFDGENGFPEPAETISVPGEDSFAAGRRLFLGRSTTVSADGLACQSCHPEGRQDGIVWAIRAEGRMQTPVLAGRLAGTGPYRWRGDAPSIEASIHHTVEGLGGTGLDPAAASSVARYLVDGIEAVPNPSADRARTALEARGERVFRSRSVGCASCHVPGAFTDGARHVLLPFGDADLSWRGTDFDTPSLLGLFAGAPYLHDGSAPTIESLFTPERADAMGRTSHLTPEDRRALVAYLQTL